VVTMHESNALRQQAPRQDAEGDEWLSGFLDGEISDPGGDPAAASSKGRQLARQISASPEARSSWAEYSLIGDVLRDQGNADTAAWMKRFNARLADEPTVLAPAPKPSRMTQPALWFVAAATVAGITWTVLSVAPETIEHGVPVASAPATTLNAEYMSYVAAHQDFAHAVTALPEMNLVQVAYPGTGQ